MKERRLHNRQRLLWHGMHIMEVKNAVELRNKKGALLDNNRLYLIIVFLFLIFFFHPTYISFLFANRQVKPSGQAEPSEQ